ncbi:MAG: hypothetical protein HUU37_07195, partial [Bdellovibrionales bacterium]|nr:hypothetical protein [Bdellovibrionales bacterium]
MDRNPITAGFGRIEEGLERLESLASQDQGGDHAWTSLLRDLKSQISGLEDVVQDRVVRNKSVPASDLLQKVVKIAIRESESLEMAPAFVLHGEGRVSMELVELSMNSLVACLNVAVASFKGQSGVLRMMNNLFPVCTFQMELRADGSEIQFVLLTDGDAASFGKSAGGDAAVRAVRESVARHGGWFSFRPLQTYGGRIEFRIPVPRARRPALVLKSGSMEVLLPAVCVAEELSDVTQARSDLPWFRVTGEEGFVPLKARAEVRGCKGVVAGVADFQMLIVADEISRVEQMREVCDP